MQPLPSTKLRPPRAASTLIARPRLEAALDAARAAQRATLLVAPAGYGKTTAVSAWLRSRQSPTAWFTVDQADDTDAEPEALLTSWLTAALTSAGAWPDAGAWSDRDAVDAARDPREVAALLETAGWRGVVVFDDVHHLGAAASAALASWVERAPDGVHTLLLARHTPALPVARWLARGQAELLGTDALRLRADEGRALVARLLPELAPAHADALVTRVEGWPAGVQLATRSLRGKADPGDVIERFTGTDRFMLAFLTEEVLLKLPDDLHEAALLLAGEPRLCAALVDAITASAGGAAVLARLEAQEAFLERLDAVDDDGPWFRFPDFFRDLLGHRLALARPDLPAVLAGRAAGWWRDRAERDRDQRHHPQSDRAEPLTAREQQVLVLLVAGATTKAIARALGLSPNTVKTHTRHLFEKLGVRTRTEAAAAARRLDLV